MTDLPSDYRLVRRRTANVLLFAVVLVVGALGYAVYAVNDAREGTAEQLVCKSDLAAADDAAQGDVLAAIGEALTNAVTGVEPQPAIDRFVEANNRMQAAQAARAEQGIRCP